MTERYPHFASWALGLPSSRRRRKPRGFCDQRYWSRSQKGNLYRRLGQATVTVFEMFDGRFGYSIFDGEKVQFGQRHYVSQRAAMKALQRVLEKGQDGKG